MTNFKIGQKIICVDDSAGIIDGSNFLKKGITYTISEFNKSGRGVALQEENIKSIPVIRQPDGSLAMAPFWDIKRFRPLTYLSINSEILEKFKIIEEKADVEIKEHA